jgi:hypothetical protein
MYKNINQQKEKKLSLREERNAELRQMFIELFRKGYRSEVCIDAMKDRYKISKATIYRNINLVDLKKQARNEN